MGGIAGLVSLLFFPALTASNLSVVILDIKPTKGLSNMKVFAERPLPPAIYLNEVACLTVLAFHRPNRAYPVNADTYYM